MDGEWVRYASKLCSVAASIDYPHPTKRSGKIQELIFSYCNQFQLVVESYQQLEAMLRELNRHSTESLPDILLSHYDLYSAEMESRFRDYGYLLVISMKTFLDLFACMVDVTLPRTKKRKKKKNRKPGRKTTSPLLTDFYAFGKEDHHKEYAELIAVFNQFRNDKVYQWIRRLTDIRNKLVHRGYHLKPVFDFRKREELTFLLYKGNDHYYNTRKIKVGSLFAKFISHIPQMEDRISQPILTSVDALEEGQAVEFVFRFDGTARRYENIGIKEV